jgi:8-oxo-dGTP diphosphatase
MTRYVVGFMFDAMGNNVVLIKKTKPQWQAGKLNGVGGKVEPGETPHQAMAREFQEESGVLTPPAWWEAFCTLHGDNFEVECFRAFSDVCFRGARTMEGEEIVKGISSLVPDLARAGAAVSNLGWLVTMALDKNNGQPFTAAVVYWDSDSSKASNIVDLAATNAAYKEAVKERGLAA